MRSSMMMCTAAVAVLLLAGCGGEPASAPVPVATTAATSAPSPGEVRIEVATTAGATPTSLESSPAPVPSATVPPVTEEPPPPPAKLTVEQRVFAIGAGADLPEGVDMSEAAIVNAGIMACAMLESNDFDSVVEITRASISSSMTTEHARQFVGHAVITFCNELRPKLSS